MARTLDHGNHRRLRVVTIVGEGPEHRLKNAGCSSSSRRRAATLAPPLAARKLPPASLSRADRPSGSKLLNPAGPACASKKAGPPASERPAESPRLLAVWCRPPPPAERSGVRSGTAAVYRPLLPPSTTTGHSDPRCAGRGCSAEGSMQRYVRPSPLMLSTPTSPPCCAMIVRLM